MVRTILLVVHIIVAFFLILVVLLQSGRSAGISGEIGGGAETFFGKNKSRTMDALFVRCTKICAALFILASLGLTIFWNA